MVTDLVGRIGPRSKPLWLCSRRRLCCPGVSKHIGLLPVSGSRAHLLVLQIPSVSRCCFCCPRALMRYSSSARSIQPVRLSLKEISSSTGKFSKVARFEASVVGNLFRGRVTRDSSSSAAYDICIQETV